MEAIVVIGMARSGKDTAADYIAEKYGFAKLVFSDLIAEELEKKGMGVNKRNMSTLANTLREEGGMDVLARHMLEKMNKLGKEKYVLVGPRSPQELVYMKKNCEKCVAIKLEAGKGERFGRRSKKDPNTEKEFFGRDKNDIENKGMAELLEMADYTIQNNSTINDLKKSIDETMAKI